MFKELTKNKAYLLGVLTADGNLSARANCIRIELHEKDKQILENLSSVFGGQVKVRHHTNVTYYCWMLPISQYGPKGYGNELYKQLEQYGIVPAKTGKEKFIVLDDKLMPHYIRGIWDGDGSFYIRTRKNTSLLMSEVCSASESFIKDMALYLEKHDIKTKVRQRKKGDSVWFTAELQSGPTKKLVDFLYGEEDCLKLDRKYDIVKRGYLIPKSTKYWTNDHIQFLIDNYHIMDTKTIANKLNRTYKSVNMKAFRLKLKKVSNES